MDEGELIKEGVAFAARFLGGVAGKVGDALGDKLAGLLRGNERTAEAYDDLAAVPEDEDLQAVLRVRLKKAIAEDEGFRAELEALMGEAAQAGVTVTQTATVTGDKNITIQAGRDVKR